MGKGSWMDATLKNMKLPHIFLMELGRPYQVTNLATNITGYNQATIMCTIRVVQSDYGFDLRFEIVDLILPNYKIETTPCIYNYGFGSNRESYGFGSRFKPMVRQFLLFTN